MIFLDCIYELIVSFNMSVKNRAFVLWQSVFFEA